MAHIREFDVQTESLQGVTLIEASAGTGKTFTLALLVLRLIIEKALPIQEIVAVTFTKAATAELKERVARFLRDSLALLEGNRSPDEIDNPPLCDYIAMIRSTVEESELCKRIEEALLLVDESAIFTIHGFCQRLLTDFAFESGAEFGREMVSDQSELVEEIRNNFWRKEILTLTPHEFASILTEIKSPKDLHNRVSAVVGSAQITVVGTVTAKPSTAEFQQRRDSILAEIYGLWEIHGTEVSSLVAETKEAGLLNGTSYKEWIYDLESLFSSPLESDEELKRARLLSRGGFNCNRGKVPPQHSFFERLEQLLPELESANEKLVKAQKMLVTWVESRYLAYSKQELTAVKDARNLGSFDDMISGVCTAVSEANPRRELFLSLVRDRFRAVLVDEFQDTDSQQFTIFKEIFSPLIFFMIGDPKQAIYKFRGGDVYAYLKARNQQGIREFTLSTNYRSESSLISGLNAIFSIPDSTTPFLTEGIEYHQIASGSSRAGITQDGIVRTPIKIWELEEPVSTSGSSGSISKRRAVQRINVAITAEISELLMGSWEIGPKSSRKRVVAKDIAILVSTSREAADLKEILNNVSIPAVTIKTGALYSSEEAVQLLGIMEAVLSPSSEKVIRAALFQKPFSLQLSAIEKNMLSVMSRFTRYHEAWESEGFMAMIQMLFDEERLYSHLITRESDGYRPLTNFRHLFEQLHLAESEQGIAPLRLVSFLRDMIANPAGEEHQQRMENDESAVKIVTIHSSKGLEYPIVFVPYPWTLTYATAEKSDVKKILHPVNHCDGETVFNLSHEADHQLAIREYNEEQQRLFYVALTRASQRLYLVHAGYYTSYSQKGKALDEQNPSYRFLTRFKMNSHWAIEWESLGSSPSIHPVPTTALNISTAIRSFDKLISSGESTKSYSSIVAHPEPIRRERTIAEPNSIYAFAKGARTGNAWHRIFEVIDYTQSLDNQIDGIVRAMGEFGFSPEKTNFDAIYAMTSATLHAQLSLHDGNPFSLNQIDRSKRITEMPFYLRAECGNPALIKMIIEEYEGFTVSIRPELFHGYLQGFIDLLFEHEEKWYVLDWKSNHLGNSPDLYSFESLASAMEENEYRLQYILYVVAVTKFLSNTMESFDYDTHIGGAYYVFLRGVNEKGSEGFWFSKPKRQTIESLLRLFVVEGETK